MAENRRVFLNRAEEIAWERSQREKEKEQHGEVLPFQEEKGETKWGLPQWMMDAWGSLTLPRDTLQGYQPTDKDVAQFGMDLAGGGVSSSIASGKAVDPNTVGMFLGRNAKGADLNALKQAEELTAQGIDREEIWKTTGWFKGLDDKWRWEISDKDFKLTDADFDSIGGNTTVTDFVGNLTEHPSLYRQYEDNPSNILGSFAIQPSFKGQAGEYRKSQPLIEERIAGLSGDKKSLGSTILHELQHAVQNREDFDGGASLQATANSVNNFYENLPHNLKTYSVIKSRIDDKEESIRQAQQTLQELRDAPDNTEDLWQQLIDEETIETTEKRLKRELGDLAWFKTQADKLAQNYPEDFIQDFDELDTIFRKGAFETYKRSQGEVEARATQVRQDLSDEERRNIPPWIDYDVPSEETWNEKGMDKKVRHVLTRLGLMGKEEAIKLDSDTSDMRVYHSSPHDFDKFDVTKIGTGEGAQVYGHGLYFAENPSIVKHYQEKFGRRVNDQIIDKEGNNYLTIEKDFFGIPQYSKLSPQNIELVEALDKVKTYEEKGVSLDNLVKRYENEIETFNKIIYNNFVDPNTGLKWSEEGINNALDFKLRQLSFLYEIQDKGLKLKKGTGKRYTVEIKAEPEEFLNLSGSFEEQSDIVKKKLAPYMLSEKELDNLFNLLEQTSKSNPLEDPHTIAFNLKTKLEREAIEDEDDFLPKLKAKQFIKAIGQWADEKTDVVDDGTGLNKLKKRLSGENILSVFENFLGRRDKKKASEFFKTLGLKGYRYKDAASRSERRNDTYNYVVFDDSIIDIMEKE